MEEEKWGSNYRRMGPSKALFFFEIETIRAYLYADGTDPVLREKLMMPEKGVTEEQNS